MALDSCNISHGAPQAPAALSGQEVRLGFDKTYSLLPDRFYARLGPTPVAMPPLVKVKVGLAEELGGRTGSRRWEEQDVD